jgi:hypothetical protein
MPRAKKTSREETGTVYSEGKALPGTRQPQNQARRLS